MACGEGMLQGGLRSRGARNYSFYGLLVKVRWQGLGAGEEIAQLLAPLPFQPRDDDPSGPVALVLHVIRAGPDITPPPVSNTASHCYGLTVDRQGDHVQVTDGLSTFRIQPRAGQGRLLLHPTFRELEPLAKHNFFLVGLFQWLLARGFYDLHAAGLVYQGRGFLLIGKSGSGKSTSALALVRRGWRFLSDDALLLRPGDDGVEALAFRRRFFLDPASAGVFPELPAHRLGTSPGGDGKWPLDVEQVYGDCHQDRVVPKVLLFTELAPHRQTTLRPLDRRSVFIELLAQSASLAFDREWAPAHLTALKELTLQVQSHQLLLGRDVYARPDKLADVIAAAHAA